MDLYFITGTSSGLGYALTEEVLERGHRVTGIGRNHPHQSNHYCPVEADLSRTESAAALSLSDPWQDQVYDRVVLVNNAGVIEPVKQIGHADAADISAHYQVNLVAPTILANQVLAQWAGEGTTEVVILNVSSGAAHRPIDGWGCYCSAKSGLAMLSEVIHEENRIHDRNCRVYALAPGVVDTPMQSTIRAAEQEEFTQLSRFQSLKAEGQLKSPFVVARNFINVIEGYYPDLAVNDRLN